MPNGTIPTEKAPGGTQWHLSGTPMAPYCILWHPYGTLFFNRVYDSCMGHKAVCMVLMCRRTYTLTGVIFHRWGSTRLFAVVSTTCCSSLPLLMLRKPTSRVAVWSPAVCMYTCSIIVSSGSVKRMQSARLRLTGQYMSLSFSTADGLTY